MIDRHGPHRDARASLCALSVVGDRLRPHAERIELEIRALTSATIASSDQVSGRVRIATTEGMAARLTPEISWVELGNRSEQTSFDNAAA